VQGGPYGIIFHHWMAGSKYLQTPNMMDAEWHHLVCVMNMDAANPADRMGVYIDNVYQTPQLGLYPDQGATTGFFAGHVQRILCRPLGASSPWNFWSQSSIADVYFIDGGIAPPDAFGQTVNGKWVPKKYTGGYGAQGIHLEFGSSGAPFNKDTGPNGFTFDTNAYFAQNSEWTDQLRDTPMRRYPRLDGKYSVNGTVDQSWYTTTQPRAGGLTALCTTSGYFSKVGANVPFPAGRWYMEYLIAATGGAGRTGFGFMRGASSYVGYLGQDTHSWSLYENGLWYRDGTYSSLGAGTYAVGDRMGVYLDARADGTADVYYSKNGAWFYGDWNGAAALTRMTGGPFRAAVHTYNTADKTYVNFGQQGWWHAPLNPEYKALILDPAGNPIT
jgi:hypothetical protein